MCYDFIYGNLRTYDKKPFVPPVYSSFISNGTDLSHNSWKAWFKCKTLRSIWSRTDGQQRRPFKFPAFCCLDSAQVKVSNAASERASEQLWIAPFLLSAYCTHHTSPCLLTPADWLSRSPPKWPPKPLAMVLMTMVARVADGLPLAASIQEDEQVRPPKPGAGTIYNKAKSSDRSLEATFGARFILWPLESLFLFFGSSRMAVSVLLRTVYEYWVMEIIPRAGKRAYSYPYCLRDREISLGFVWSVYNVRHWGTSSNSVWNVIVFKEARLLNKLSEYCSFVYQFWVNVACRLWWCNRLARVCTRGLICFV